MRYDECVPCACRYLTHRVDVNVICITDINNLDCVFFLKVGTQVLSAKTAYDVLSTDLNTMFYIYMYINDPLVLKAKNSKCPLLCRISGCVILGSVPTIFLVITIA